MKLKIKIPLALILILALGYVIYSPDILDDDWIANNLNQKATDTVNDTTEAGKSYANGVMENATEAATNYTIGVLNNYSDEHHAKTMEELDAIYNNSSIPFDPTAAPIVHNATTPEEAIHDLTGSVAKDEASVGIAKILMEAENATENYTAKALATKDGLTRK